MFKGTIEVGILKEIFSFANKIVYEFRLRLTQDGWATDFVDPANVMLASIRVPREVFETYTLDEEVEIGTDVLTTTSILRLWKDRDLAEVSISKEELSFKVGTITYSRALIDPEAIRRTPKIDIMDKIIDGSETEGARITLSLSDLRDLIKTAPSEYGKLLIHCKPEEAYIFNGVEKKEITDFEAAKETISLYTIEYFEPILSLKTASTLEVYYTEDQPCIIIPDTRFTLRYAVAPYIPEEKTEYLPSEVKPEWEIPLSEEMLKVYRKPLKTIEPVFLVIDERNLYFVEAVGVGEKYAITAYVEMGYPVPTQVEARGTYDLFSEFKTIVGKAKEITLNERDGKLYAGEVEVGKRSETVVTVPKPEGKHFYISTRRFSELAKVKKSNIALRCEKEKLAEFICFIEGREDPEGSAVSETYCPGDFIRVFNINKRYVVGKWAEVWCTEEVGTLVFIVFSEVKKGEEHKLLTYISDIIPERERSLIEEVKRQLRIIKEPPLFAEIESFVEKASEKLKEFDGEQPEARLKRLGFAERELRSTTYITHSVWAQSEEPINRYNILIELGKRFLEELNALGYEDKIEEYQDKLAEIEGWTVRRDALRGKLNALSVRIEKIRDRINNTIEWAKHNLDFYKRNFEEAKDIIEHFGAICKAVARVYDKLKFKKVKAELEWDQDALKTCLKDYAECNLAKFREDAAKDMSVAYWAKMLTKAFKELPGLWKEEIVERFKHFYEMMHKKSVDALFFELAAEAEKEKKPPAKPKEIVVKASNVKILFTPQEHWRLVLTYKLDEKENTYTLRLKSTSEVINAFERREYEIHDVDGYDKVTVKWDHLAVYNRPRKWVIELTNVIPLRYNLNVETVEMSYSYKVDFIDAKYRFKEEEMPKEEIVIELMEDSEALNYLRVSLGKKLFLAVGAGGAMYKKAHPEVATDEWKQKAIHDALERMIEEIKPKPPAPEERVAELKKKLRSIRENYEAAEKTRAKPETEENLNDFGIAVSILESSLKKIDEIIERADAIYRKFGLVAASTLSSEASALKEKIISLKEELEGKIDRVVSKMKEWKEVQDSLWACDAVRDIFDEIKWKKLPPEKAADQDFFKIALEVFSTCDKRKIKNHFAISAEGYWLEYISAAIKDIDIERVEWRDKYKKFYEFMFKESADRLYDAIKAKKAEIKPPKPPKPYPTELKDYAGMLISVQKHIGKGWYPIAVDLANDEIQLYNPEAPYRKRNRYKKMTKREREFIKAVSDALTIVAEESRLRMIAAHIVTYSDILVSHEQALKDYPELLEEVRKIKAAVKKPEVKPPKPVITPEIEKRVGELSKEMFQAVDRLKFLQTAEATEEVIEEADKIKAECEAKKPEIDELLDKIPEKTDLYEKAYDVWSSVRTCIDKAGRLEREAKEWMEKMPELRKRILSEISRLESEYNIKISEGDVHIFVTDLLKELRKIPEEQWERRISGAVKEFAEEQRKKIVEVIPATERARLKGIIAGEISIQQMRMKVKPPAEERRTFEEILLKELEKVEKDKRAKYIEDKVREWFLEKAAEWKAVPPEKPPGVPVEKPPAPPPPEVIEIKAEDVAKKLIAELSTELGLARMSRSEVERVVQEKLPEINRLAEDVAKGKIAEEEAIKQIKKVAKEIIEKLPPPPPPPRVRIAYRRFLLARLLRVSPDDLRTVAENVDRFPKEEIARAVREALAARLTRANVDRAIELFTNSDFLKIAEHVGLRAEVERKAEEARKLKEMFEATVSPTRLNVMVKLLTSNIERGLFTFRPDDVCKIAPFINLADPDLISKLREAIRTMREPERPIPARRFHDLTEHECFRKLKEVI